MGFLRRTKLTLVAVVMSIAAGCQTASFEEPADPSYTWLNGSWSNWESNWPQTLDLRVGDGNKVKGTFSLTSPNSGRTYTGPVEGEVNGKKVELVAQMYDLRDNYKFDLRYHGDLLSGTRSGSERSWFLNVRKE